MCASDCCWGLSLTAHCCCFNSNAICQLKLHVLLTALPGMWLQLPCTAPLRRPQLAWLPHFGMVMGGIFLFIWGTAWNLHVTTIWYYVIRVCYAAQWAVIWKPIAKIDVWVEFVNQSILTSIKVVPEDHKNFNLVNWFCIKFGNVLRLVVFFFYTP